MTDNKPMPATAFNAATDEVTHSGDTADVQLVRSVGVTGAEGSKTVLDKPVMDIAARAAFVKVTDGTNLQAMLDVVARAGFFKLTDGILFAEICGETYDSLAVCGGTAHGTTNVGNPILGGHEAIAHGTNPAAVPAGARTKDYANRHGIPFQIGGHPNVISASARITAANADVALSPGTVATGTKLVITRLVITLSNACTVTAGVGCKIGFGTTTLPADTATGIADILYDNDGIPPGGGAVVGNGGGMLGVGGDGAELRITNDVPTGGALIVTYSYYTIES